METNRLVLMLLLAVLSSSVVTTLINRLFSKTNDDATADKTRAEAADILSQASERTLAMMHQTMVTAQARIMVLEGRVTSLEKQLNEYERRHGPLGDPWDTGVPGV